MLIDFHSHIWRREWRHESMWDAMADVLAQRLGGEEGVTSRETIKNQIFTRYLDPWGERHLHQMEEAGIDLTVLHPLDYGLGPAGEPPASIEEQNAAHAELLRRYPDKFAAFVGVDPRRPYAVDLLEKGVNEWGFRGLKLHPTTGFHLHHGPVEALYQKACELNIPVLTHTGHITPPLDASYAHPASLDAVAERYPRMTIIAAHMAYDWWEELAAVGRKRSNLGADISGWQTTAAVSATPFCRALQGMLDSVGSRNVLFGTDGLVFGRAMAAREWISFLRRLPRNEGNDIILSDGEVEAILGLNAQRILGL